MHTRYTVNCLLYLMLWWYTHYKSTGANIFALWSIACSIRTLWMALYVVCSMLPLMLYAPLRWELTNNGKLLWSLSFSVVASFTWVLSLFLIRTQMGDMCCFYTVHCIQYASYYFGQSIIWSNLTIFCDWDCNSYITVHIMGGGIIYSILCILLCVC